MRMGGLLLTAFAYVQVWRDSHPFSLRLNGALALSARRVSHRIFRPAHFVVRGRQLMGPLLWHLWIEVGTANANFYFAVGLVQAGAQVEPASASSCFPVPSRRVSRFSLRFVADYSGDRVYLGHLEGGSTKS